MPLYGHFTTSATLPFLKLSRFSISSLDTLLFTYGYAPMAGEVSDGRAAVGVGYDAATSFAEICYSTCVKWNVPEIYNQYGKRRWQPSFTTTTDVEKYLNAFVEDRNFATARNCIVQLLRHKQMGVLPVISESVKEQVLSFIDKSTHLALRQYAANYVVAKYLQVTDQYKNDKAFYYKFICNLENNIPSDFLSLSTDHQKSIVNKLVLPEGLVINELKEDKNDKTDTFDDGLTLVIRFPTKLDLMRAIFESKLDMKFSPTNLNYVKQQLLAASKTVMALRDVFQKIFTTSKSALLSDNDKQWIEKPFPIAFILTKGEGFCKEYRGGEYRSTKPLQLGKDIRTVAVDAEHVQALQLFFKQNGIRVRVITMEQLKRYEVEEDSSYMDRFRFFQAAYEHPKAALAMASVAAIAATASVAHLVLK